MSSSGTKNTTYKQKKDTDLRFYLDAVNNDGDVDDGILMHPGSFP